MADFTRELIGLAMLTLVPLVALLAWGGVRKRRRKQEDLLGELAEPSDILSRQDESGPWIDGFYVATTFEADPLQRVWAHGLGARGRGQFLFLEDGVTLRRVGERTVYIASSSIKDIARGTTTIDRVTESGGLLQIFWIQNGTELITSLRVLDSGKLGDFTATTRGAK